MINRSKTTVIIIDDEAPARNLIRSYLGYFPEIEVLTECDNGFVGLKKIQELKPDFIFLDIQMPKLSGIEMIEVLEKPPKVIFTTAFDQYAIKAFELSASDYLLKPFSQSRFNDAVTKVINQKGVFVNENIQENSEMAYREILDRVVVKKGSEIIVIPVSQVNYIEAQDDYVMIYSDKGKFLKSITMKYLEDHLPSNEFVRIHRSYILQVSKISKLEQYDKDNYIAIIGNQKLKVSRAGYKRLKEVLKL